MASAIIPIIRDNYVQQNAPTLNFGASAIVDTSRNPTRRGLWMAGWTPPLIPVGATFVSATFFRELVETPSGGGISLELRQLISGFGYGLWTEGNNTAGSGADWNTFNGSTAWPGSGGASTPNVDYFNSTVVVYNGPVAAGIMGVDVSPIVARNVAGGAVGDNGHLSLMEKAVDEAGAFSEYKWASRTHGTSLHPYIEVIYTLPGGSSGSEGGGIIFDRSNDPFRQLGARGVEF